VVKGGTKLTWGVPDMIGLGWSWACVPEGAGARGGSPSCVVLGCWGLVDKERAANLVSFQPSPLQ
jgi:hypothetical protein